MGEGWVVFSALCGSRDRGRFPVAPQTGVPAHSSGHRAVPPRPLAPRLGKSSFPRAQRSAAPDGSSPRSRAAAAACAAGPSAGWKRHKARRSPSSQRQLQLQPRLPAGLGSAPSASSPPPRCRGRGTLHSSRRRRCAPRGAPPPAPARPVPGEGQRPAAPAGTDRGSPAERAPGAPTGDAPAHACPGRPRPFACRRLAQTHALTHPHTHTHAHSLRPPGLQFASPRPPRRFASAMASPGSGFWSFGAEEGSAAAESPGTGRGAPSSRAGPARRSRGASAAALLTRRRPARPAGRSGGDRRRL